MHCKSIARPRSRHGFTLIELLVVIGLLSVMVALVAYAVRNLPTAAKEKATRATIEKIDGLLTDRMEAFNRRGTGQKYISQARALGLSGDAADIYGRKLEFQDRFPQTFAEASGLLTEAGLTAPNPKPSPAVENAMVLHFFLTRGALGYDTAAAEEVFTGAEIRYEGDWAYFVDAWEHPIRFYRWPTRLIKPNGTAINREIAGLLIPYALTAENYDLSVDPDDPAGHTEAAVQSTLIHTPNTYYTTLLVSAGPDGQLGLHEVTDTANFGHLAAPVENPIDPNAPDPALFDNLTNRQQ